MKFTLHKPCLKEESSPTRYNTFPVALWCRILWRNTDNLGVAFTAVVAVKSPIGTVDCQHCFVITYLTNQYKAALLQQLPAHCCFYSIAFKFDIDTTFTSKGGARCACMEESQKQQEQAYRKQK